MGQRKKLGKIGKAKAMAGVDLNVVTVGLLGRSLELGKRSGAMGGGGIGKASRMEFHHGGLESSRGLHLVGVGIEKEAGEDFGLVQLFDDGSKYLDLVSRVQAAFGGHFGPIFGDQADLGRLQAKGKIEHGRGSRHFEVEFLAKGTAEAQNIVVLNVTTVLPKVNGNRVGPRREAGLGKGGGVWLRDDAGNRYAVSCLPESGEVINVYAQPNHRFILP